MNCIYKIPLRLLVEIVAERLAASDSTLNDALALAGGGSGGFGEALTFQFATLAI